MFLFRVEPVIFSMGGTSSIFTTFGVGHKKPVQQQYSLSGQAILQNSHLETKAVSGRRRLNATSFASKEGFSTVCVTRVDAYLTVFFCKNFPHSIKFVHISCKEFKVPAANISLYLNPVLRCQFCPPLPPRRLTLGLRAAHHHQVVAKCWVEKQKQQTDNHSHHCFLLLSNAPTLINSVLTQPVGRILLLSNGKFPYGPGSREHSQEVRRHADQIFSNSYIIILRNKLAIIWCKEIWLIDFWVNGSKLVHLISADFVLAS